MNRLILLNKKNKSINIKNLSKNYKETYSLKNYKENNES